MSIQIQSFNTITVQDIQSFEERIGFVLPDDYRNFLSQYNGGVTEKYVFKVEDINQDILTDIFFGVNNSDEEFDLDYMFNEYAGEIPDSSLVIGADPGGNFILLITSGEDTGVYYWDHTLFFPESSEEENTYYIAESFNEFWNSLQPLEE